MTDRRDSGSDRVSLTRVSWGAALNNGLNSVLTKVGAPPLVDEQVSGVNVLAGSGAGNLSSGGGSGSNPLHRTLGLRDLTAIGIGGVIGAGVYVLTGQAAALYAGPAIVLSFCISGVACLFSALCYSELAAMIPVAGSAYSFASATLGQGLGWVIGWDLILEYLFGASAVAVGFSGYLTSLVADTGVAIYKPLVTAPVAYVAATESFERTEGIINLPAVLICLVMTAVQIRGIQESAWFNNAVVALKIVVLLLFVCVGAAYVDTGRWEPFVPPATDTVGIFGWTGVFRGASVLFFSYIGFDSISAAAQEAKNPQRDLPIATLFTLLVCTALYVAVGFVLTGMVDYRLLNSPDPIAVAVDAGGDSLFWLRPIVKVGAILGLTSVIMVQILGQARILYAMADDGLLPPAFATVHHKYKTPHVATMWTGVLAAIISGLLPIDVLGEMVSIGTLFAFALVCAGVLVLRKRQPHLKRPFRTPWVPAVPLLGIISALIQMIALPGGTWLRLFIWMVCGQAIYFLYSRKHAKPHAVRQAKLLGLRPASSASPSAASDAGDAADAGSTTPGSGDTPSSISGGASPSIAEDVAALARAQPGLHLQLPQLPQLSSAPVALLSPAAAAATSAVRVVNPVASASLAAARVSQLQQMQGAQSQSQSQGQGQARDWAPVATAAAAAAAATGAAAAVSASASATASGRADRVSQAMRARGEATLPPAAAAVPPGAPVG